MHFLVKNAQHHCDQHKWEFNIYPREVSNKDWPELFTKVREQQKCNFLLQGFVKTYSQQHSFQRKTAIKTKLSGPAFC